MTFFLKKGNLMYKAFIAMICSISTVLLLAKPLLANDVPSEVGGFRLGEDITEYPEVEFSNFLKEVVITDWHGFRKGIIAYGICAYPGKIVRITMKYENSSKGFYKKLLREFKHRYGEPDEWNGDAFGILFKWKWRFKDEKGRQINLTLQHNLKDERENLGNIVKLYYPEREAEERECFNRQCEINKDSEEKEKLAKRKETNWDYLIPR